MNPFAAIATGFVFAAANAAHCAGMCGVFAMRAGASPGRVAGLLAYGAGKASTYAFLGCLAGALGAGVLARGATAQAALGLGVGAVLVAAGLARILPAGPRAARGAGLAALLGPALHGAGLGPSWAGRFTLGALTAALPCGVVYLAALQASATGSALSALLLMAGFAAGTMPALGAVGLLGRRVLAGVPPTSARVVAGALTLALGLVAAGRAAFPLFTEGAASSCSR